MVVASVEVHNQKRDPVQGQGVLGGSGVVISRVISRATLIITHIRGLITPLVTTLNPKP